MTKAEAERELKAAGADYVSFGEEFPYSKGLGIEVAGHRNAMRWDYDHDGIAEAVEKLKAWIATVDRATPPATA